MYKYSYLIIASSNLKIKEINMDMIILGDVKNTQKVLDFECLGTIIKEKDLIELEKYKSLNVVTSEQLEISKTTIPKYI